MSIKLFRQNFIQKINQLKMSDSALLDKLTRIVNDNYDVRIADLAQKTLNSSHVNIWHKQGVFPTSQVIREAFSILFFGERNRFNGIIFTTPEDIKSVLKAAINKFQITNDKQLETFKQLVYAGYYERIINNPFNSKVTLKDLVYCLYYIIISYSLYSPKNKPKPLTLQQFLTCTNFDNIMSLINIKELLDVIQHQSLKAKKIDLSALEKYTLLILLKIINPRGLFR